MTIDTISRYDDRGPAWYWNTLRLGEHTGTHFDAPVHWISGKAHHAPSRTRLRPFPPSTVLGAFVTADDKGSHGPYRDFETAVCQQNVYWIHETTSRICDSEHGVVFAGGILFHPGAVERCGAINASGVIRRER